MLNLIKITCPFCNKEKETESVYNDWIKCENHGEVNVVIHSHGEYELYNSNYLLYIFKENSILYKIIENGKGLETLKDDIPSNSTITPDNFEQKLKMYLIFI